MTTIVYVYDGHERVAVGEGSAPSPGIPVSETRVFRSRSLSISVSPAILAP